MAHSMALKLTSIYAMLSAVLGNVGTIQLDMALPERFELEYTDEDGSRKRPVMIHRALFGSIERFFGILIEHFAGRFPLWISPCQVRIITVADRHQRLAQKVRCSTASASVPMPH